MAKGTFGERLKRERELRDVSLKEISTATRIAPKFLEALENEQWDKLPGGVFGRGFVRSIARYLGLSEENFLSDYDLARGESAAPAEQKLEERIPSPPKWVPAVAVVILLVVLAGLAFGVRYVWLRHAAHRAAKQSSAASVSTKRPASSTLGDSSATTASSGLARQESAPLDLSVAASADTQVRIVADRSVVHDGLISAGQNLRFSANEKFEITPADSSLLLLRLNGQALSTSGSSRASGTISLTSQDVRPNAGGTSQP